MNNISNIIHYEVTTIKHVPILVHCSNDKYVVILLWFLMLLKG
jgi:hypothetical protein